MAVLESFVSLVEFFPGIKRCSRGGGMGEGGEGRHLQFCKADIRDQGLRQRGGEGIQEE
jgi:hypothetical protein